MNINVSTGEIFQTSSDLIVLPISTQEHSGRPIIEQLDALTNGGYQLQSKIAEFEAQPGQKFYLPAPQNVSAKYIAVMGMGDAKHFHTDIAREIAGSSVKLGQRLGANRIAIQMPGEHVANANIPAVVSAMTEALHLSAYDFDAYKTKKTSLCVGNIEIYTKQNHSREILDREMRLSADRARGIILARNLVNTPAKDMLPEHLAHAAIKISEDSQGLIHTKILSREECEARGMGAYLAVAAGADSEPKFIHLHYRPEHTKASIALVGKGVTFDSGGLSLKPSKGMETMKCDMAGSAAVLGVFESLRTLRPDVEVHGIIAATENMPSGKAIRPGDVVRASNGKTIEILNTDAEGRLTLADALTYAQEQNVDTVIDLATLTGACVVALGEEVAALFSNDDETAKKILISAGIAGEPIWQLPLRARYARFIESKIADLRNIATIRYAGSTTAALFLQNFIEENQKWVHLDIAGPAFAERSLNSYTRYGGSGFGVSTLLHYIESL